MAGRQTQRSVKTRAAKDFDTAARLTLVWVIVAGVSFYLRGLNFEGSSCLMVFVVGFLMAVVVVWWLVIKAHRWEIAAGKTLEDLQALSPEAFEEWVAARFRDLGYSVELTGDYGDHGVDLVVEKADEIAVVQCKNYRVWSVGEPVLRDLFGAMHDFDADAAYLVTTGKLTRAATDWVAGKPIEVWDGDYVARLSKRMALRGAKANAEGVTADALASDAPSRNSQVESRKTPRLPGDGRPACPKCGKELVERRNRATGDLFLACPGFPACRYTRPLPR